jgi:hypothetical protein
MRCDICKRPLNKPAMTVPSKDGLKLIGPKCAKRYQTQKTSKEKAYRDAATIDMFEAMA